MKKLLLVLAGAAMLAFGFTSCGDKPADTPSSKPEQDAPAPEAPEAPEAPAEEVLYEKAAADWANCSFIADLTGKTGTTLLVTIENTSGASRNGWGVGSIGLASDKDNCYGTWADPKVEANFSGTETTCVQEIALADLPTEGNPYLTANMWNDCVIVKVVLK